MKIWHSFFFALILGYALGYWLPSIGDISIGKLYPRK